MYQLNYRLFALILILSLLMPSALSRPAEATDLPAPVQAPLSPAGEADWPAPRYNSGHINYNLNEQELAPPLAQDIEASFIAEGAAGDAGLGSIIASGDQLFFIAFYRDTGPFASYIPELRAYDKFGHEQWRYSEAYGDDPWVSGDTIVLTKKGGQTLVALNTATGLPRWEHPIEPPQLFGNGTFLVQGNRVYLFEQADGQGGVLVARDLVTGQEVWRQNVVGDLGLLDPPVAAADHLFIVADDEVIAFNLADGSEAWRTTVEDANQIIATDTATILQYGTWNTDKGLIAFEPGTGNQQWSVTRPCDPDNYFFGMGADDERLVFMETCEDLSGPTTRTLAALDLSTGVTLWEADPPALMYNFGMANDFLYISSLSSQFNPAIYIYRLTDGSQAQFIEATTADNIVAHLTVANGRLYGSGAGVVYVWKNSSVGTVGYLENYDEDDDPLTNPQASDEVPLIDRDGDYGARVTVGARVVTTTQIVTATLRVYGDDGSLYKSGVGLSDRYGNSFWFVPLEYAAEGYEYDVALFNGETLPRRRIDMPANPAANTAATQDLDGLQWLNPPDTVGQVPATLRLALPPDFPDGPTSAMLTLRSTSQGGNFISGQRVGDNVEFELNQNNVVRGTFVAEALAQTGDYTAYSPEHTLTLNAGALSELLPSMVFASRRDAQGQPEAVAYTFEREPLGGGGDVKAEIANIVPDPGGVQIIVRVTTPPEDPEDPNTKERPIRIKGLDQNGNEIGSAVRPVPAGATDVLVPLSLSQRGAQPISTIELQTEQLIPPEPGEEPPPPPPPPQCEDPDDPPEEPDKESEKKWYSQERFHITLDEGVGAEAAYGIGAAASAYGQADLVQGKVQGCVEYGGRLGAEVGAGPAWQVGFGYDIPGPGHDAPVGRGVGTDVSVKAVGGVKLSFVRPDNWETADTLGTIGIGFTAAPEAGASGGVSRVICKAPPDPTKDPNEDRCCEGSSCPPPPGGDHPDDTLSVVLNNLSPNTSAAVAAQDRWKALANRARAAGFKELERYATFQADLVVYLAEIQTFPVDEPLSEARQDVLTNYMAFRTLSAAELGPDQATALAQWRLLKQNNAHVLLNGYYPEMMAMLDSYGISARLVDADFAPDELAGELLVVPTGGLYGLDDVPGFRDRLERFVAEGGTLLVMAQPDNASLDVLPSGGFSQVGYEEDISCYSDAMTMLSYHPMLSSLSIPSVNANVDGYLTDLPDAATLLMKRTKNDQGAFALYEHGNGRVIVTNMYDDWGRTVGQSSYQVRTLFRDVSRWATDPGELPDTQPGGSVTVPLTVINHTDGDAALVRYVVREPDGLTVTISSPTQTVSLAPGEDTTLNPNFAPGDGPLGIWQLNYELLDEAQAVVQQETAGAIFTVSDPPVLAANLAADVAPTSVTSTTIFAGVDAALDKAVYQAEDTVHLTLTITLTELSAVSELQVMASLGEETQQKIITAQENQQVSFALPADFSGNGLLFYGVYDNATGQGLYLNTLWVAEAGEAVTITSDQRRYAPGDRVTLTLQSAVSETLYLKGPGLDRLEQVQPGAQQLGFTLPSPLTSGPYAVTYLDNGQSRAARFDVDGPSVVIEALETSVPQAEAGSRVPVSATVRSDTGLEVYLLGTLAKQEGNLRVLEQTRTLTVGQQVLTFTVPFSVTTSGMARFDLALVDRNDPSVRYASAARRLSTDAPELMAVRAPAAMADPGETVAVTLDWYSPVAQSISVTLQVDGRPVLTEPVALSQGFAATTMDLPTDLDKGAHTVLAVATVGDLTTRASAVLVIASITKVYLPLALK